MCKQAQKHCALGGWLSCRCEYKHKEKKKRKTHHRQGWVQEQWMQGSRQGVVGENRDRWVVQRKAVSVMLDWV